jgi:hypothetical protein
MSWGLKFMARHWRDADEKVTYETVEEALNQVVSSDIDVQLDCAGCNATFTWERPALGDLQDVAANFFTKAWFSRLWVIQEVATNVEKTFYWGQHCVNWTIVMHAAEALSFGWKYNSWPAIPQKTTKMAVHRVEDMYIILSAYRPLSNEPYQDVWLWLYYTSLHLTSEPRDRIYAIRTLAGADKFGALKPDYNIDVEALWTEVATFSLTARSHWDTQDNLFCSSPVFTLALAGLQTRRAGDRIASWIPNFGAWTANAFRKYECYVHESRLCNAGGRSRHIKPIIHGSELLVTGLSVSRITSIGPGTQQNMSIYRERFLPRHEECRAHEQDDVIPWYLECLHFVQQVESDHFHIPSDMKQLLEHGQRIGSQSGPSYEEFEDYVSDVVPTEALFTIDLHQMFDDLNAFIGYDNLKLLLDSTRILCCTSNGQPGWVPETAQGGDVICLFQDCPFPFVLREREGGCYTLIGDAYIHGIMHGEAWPDDGAGVTTLVIK